MSIKFDKLLKDAKTAAIECQKLEKPAKLSAKAFLRDAMANAKSNPARLKKLRESIEKESGFTASRTFMRNATKWLRERSIVRATADVRRLNWLGDMDSVMAELAVVQSNVLELFALAVQITSERYPESFGHLENWEVHVEATERAKAKCNEIYKKISTEFDSSDLNIGTVGIDGRALITFAATNGEVPLAPIETAGARLSDWLIHSQK